MKLRLASALAIVLLFGLIFTVLMSSVASAADVGGTWTGTCSRTFAGGSDSANARLDIDSSGDGTLTMAGSSYSVDGSVSGSTYVMHTQFGWDGVSYCDCTVTFTVSGGSMSGSGSFVNAGVTIYLQFDLTSGGGLGFDLTITPEAAAIGGLAVLTAFVGLGASLMQPPQLQRTSPGPLTPTHQPHQGATQHTAWQAPQGTSYQQGAEPRTTEVDSGPPVEGTSMGGAGLQWPTLNDQNNNPYPPRNYDSQYQPLCPTHQIPCQAMFPYQNQLEPGSWYCPRCQQEGRTYHDEMKQYTGERRIGYPWGSYRP